MSEQAVPIPVAANASPRSLVRRLLSEPIFVVVLAVLLVSAVGLHGTVQYLKLHFKKLPVPLRVHPAFKATNGPAWETKLRDELHSPLQTLPEVVGRWVQVSRDRALSGEIAETLGADKNYVFRDFVNTRVTGKSPQDVLKELEGKTWQEREQWLSQIERRHPEAVIRAAVTYYTGKADTVAHVPERCYLGEGYNEISSSRKRFAVGDGLDVRVLTFESPDSPRRVCVGYFFAVNGRYTSNSLDVRASLQSLLVKYAYYAKVELLSMHRDPNAASSTMEEFLTAAMGDIEQVLPDWSQYKDRK